MCRPHQCSGRRLRNLAAKPEGQMLPGPRLGDRGTVDQGQRLSLQVRDQYRNGRPSARLPEPWRHTFLVAGDRLDQRDAIGDQDASHPRDYSSQITNVIERVGKYDVGDSFGELERMNVPDHNIRVSGARIE